MPTKRINFQHDTKSKLDALCRHYKVTEDEIVNASIQMAFRSWCAFQDVLSHELNVEEPK